MFRTLEVISRHLDIRLPRYKQNILFFGFKIGYTALFVIILEHWMLFCVDWTYGYQDTVKFLYSPALKLGL